MLNTTGFSKLLNALKKMSFLLFFIAGMQSITIGQETGNRLTVKGSVLSENGETLPGVSIMEKGTKNGTISNAEGNFSITVNDQNAVLRFTYLGFQPKELNIEGRDNFEIILQEQAIGLDEVVVVGYGSQNRKDLTGSVASVDIEELEGIPAPNIGEAIQGKIAGVQIVNSGNPGTNPTIRIRGVGTIGNNDPLVVVDGMPLNGGLNQVNMNDVESMQVLKDASATAIYGARGANGVVIITTKKGTRGESAIKFNYSTGIAEPTNMVDVLNAQQFAQYHNEMLSNGGIEPNPDFANPESLGAGTDWLDAFFRAGTKSNYTLSYSTANEKSKVYSSLNYFKQKGTIISTAYERYILQFNTDTKITDNISFGNNLKLNHDIKNSGDVNIQNAMLSLPTQPIRRSDGVYSGPIGQPIYSGDIQNPIGKANTVQNETKGYNIQGSLFGEVEFFDHLKFKTLIGMEGNFWKPTTWAPAYQWDSHAQEDAYLSESSNQSLTYMWDNTLTYENNFTNGLNLVALLGTSAQENRYEYISGSIQNFPSDQTQTLNNGVDQVTLNGTASEWSIFSYFARINMNYYAKYYLTATVRRDGSSRFGEGNKFGTFPSVSAAWRLSKEDFFNVDFVNDLKIRAGFGITGNQEIGNYSFASTYNTYLYNFNGNYVTAAVPTVLPNPDVKWESQEQYNVGVDIALLDERINLSVDGYIKNTKDMLVPQSVPVTSGYSDVYVPYVNAGEIKNTGVELKLNTQNILKSDFSWNSDVVLSYNKNEVVDINSDVPLTTGSIGLNYNLSRIQNGQPVNVFYGYIQNGLFQNQSEVDGHASQVPGDSPSNGTAPGDIRFSDLNNDGLITDADRAFIGDPNPDFIFSFNNTLNYKNFSLNIFLQGVYGNEIFNANRIFTEGMAVTTNQVASVLDRWNGEGTSSSVPRAVYGDPNNNSRASTRFVEDGSYLRVKSVMFSYTFPDDLFGKKYFKNAKVYISGQNLLTITNYSGFDPEVAASGIDNNFYPVTSTVSVGLNVGL